MRGCDVALLGLIEVGLACSGRANSNTLPPELQVLGAPSQTLDVKFPLSSPPYAVNVQPGGTLQASDTVDAPEADVGPLSRHGSNLFVFMMVDPDINTTHPTYVGLHTMVANLTPYNENGAASHSSQPFTTVATYIAPEPPAGEFHDYTLLAFHQPPHFSIPAKYASYVATTPTSPLNRINFPLQQFIADTNLGPVVAANWFKEGSA